MARGNAYCHAFMRMQNVSTRPAESSERTATLELIDAL